jgi:hypothetical protein
MTWNDIVWKGAVSYTQGRWGHVPKYITFHHIVGTMESAASIFANPAAQRSTHFAVGARGAWQFVDTDDTAWGNTNWDSNLESISIEHEGDWRFGYTNPGCLEQSAQLVALLRKTHPTIIGFNRHRQVAQTATVCPGDLPCEDIWNRATQILEAESRPTPPPVAPPITNPVNIQVTDVQNKTVVANKDLNLWDLNFNTWGEAKAVKTIPKGTLIEVSATAKHPLGGLYYLTEYSFSKGIMNGINSVDVDEVGAPVIPPEPPKPEVPPVEPPKPPEPPKPTKDEEQDARLSSLETAVKALQELLNKVISWITSWRQ